MTTPRTRRSVELPAGTIHYREAGPAEGPTVVFVHGFLVDDTLWSDVPERLGALGFRALAPTWPLGAHATPMRPDAQLSPRAIAGIVRDFLEELDLHDVTLVGNDTGGAICQLVLQAGAERIGRLVLTNCDAFEKFPPAPFGALFRIARHPVLARPLVEGMRSARLRNGVLGFGPLVARKLTAAESAPWAMRYLTNAGVRRDVAHFARAWTGRELLDSASWLADFDRPVLLCWAPEDRFFTIDLAHRLVDVFPEARLVEVPGARTFLALDQPGRLAEEIAAFVEVRAGS